MTTEQIKDLQAVMRLAKVFERDYGFLPITAGMLAAKVNDGLSERISELEGRNKGWRG